MRSVGQPDEGSLAAFSFWFALAKFQGMEGNLGQKTPDSPKGNSTPFSGIPGSMDVWREVRCEDYGRGGSGSYERIPPSTHAP